MANRHTVPSIYPGVERYVSTGLGWPTCYVCRRPVDEIFETTDLCTDAMLVAVRCHDAVQNVRVSRMEMVSANGFRMDGWAFVPNCPECGHERIADEAGMLQATEADCRTCGVPVTKGIASHVD